MQCTCMTSVGIQFFNEQSLTEESRLGRLRSIVERRMRATLYRHQASIQVLPSRMIRMLLLSYAVRMPLRVHARNLPQTAVQ